MFVDDDGNSLVSTSYMDSENEVEVVFDETTNLMASMSSKGGNDKGYDNNSMLEQWRETNWDDDYDPYVYVQSGLGPIAQPPYCYPFQAPQAHLTSATINTGPAHQAKPADLTWNMDIKASSHFSDNIYTDSEPFKDPRSCDYTLALDDDTKMLDAPASPDNTTDSNSDIEPFEGDLHEADLKESSEEDPLEDDSSNEDLIEADEPLQAQVTPTPPIQTTPTFPVILV
ncbi:hypothetical protein Tco_0878150 [Tanacetum coccineum]|uniref:Uncharacterized protein n=1 Tax=Tanacetum coccineum TaxID=301880 RepID=A0ABQ5BYY5_9ASTR